MPFTRKDLFYDDYDWKAKEEHDDPKLRDFPDNVLLARKEGYEILYFVNACARMWDWKDPSKSDYQNIEKKIRKVPSHIHGRKQIRQWLEVNWLKD